MIPHLDMHVDCHEAVRPEQEVVVADVLKSGKNGLRVTGSEKEFAGMNCGDPNACLMRLSVCGSSTGRRARFVGAAVAWRRQIDALNIGKETMCLTLIQSVMAPRITRLLLC